MKPDAIQHNPNKEYIRQLVRDTGLSVNACADKLGIQRRTFWRYILKCPYPVQYCLEKLGAQDGID